MDFYLNHIDNTIFKAIICLTVPLISIAALFNFIWNISIIKKIKLNAELKSNANERAKYDMFGNFARLAHNYKVEVVKYSFLLSVNIIELLTVSAISIGDISSYFYILKNPSHFDKFVNTSICFKEYLNLPNTQMISSIVPPINFFLALGGVCFLFSMTLCTCLIKYLHDDYYDIKGSFRWIKRFLIFTIFPSFLLLFSAIKQLMIFQNVIEPVMHIIYFCILVRYSRKFHHNLKRRAIDLKIICKSKARIQGSIKLAHQFAIISTLNIFFFGCFIISNLLSKYIFVLSIFLYFAPCYSDYVFGRVIYTPPLTTHEQFKQIYLAFSIVNWISNFFGVCCSICISTLYILVSFFMFCKNIWRDLKMRFGYGNPTRFTPQLVQHLI